MTTEFGPGASPRHEQYKINLEAVYTLAQAKWKSFSFSDRQVALGQVADPDFNLLCGKIYNDLDSRSISEYQTYFDSLLQDPDVKNALAENVSLAQIYLAFVLVVVSQVRDRYHVTLVPPEDIKISFEVRDIFIDISIKGIDHDDFEWENLEYIKIAYEIYADLQSNFYQKINKTDSADLLDDELVGMDENPFSGYTVIQLRKVIDAISSKTPAKTLLFLEEYLSTSVDSLDHILEAHRER